MEHVKSAMPMMLTIIVKKPGSMMEKLLSVRMQDQHQWQVPFNLMLIQEKAKRFYEELKKKHGKEPHPPPFINNFPPNVKVVNLPLNTTSTIQPMDQGVIANFTVTMNGVWKNICPQFVHDFCKLEKVTKESKEVFSNT
ncbi:hypothetical protein Celaphus_00005496, partial [Cervus elaphus hippelaphus]